MKLDLTICRASEVVALVKEYEQRRTPFNAVISLEHPCNESVSAEGGRAPRLGREVGPQWDARQCILTCWDIEEANPEAAAPDRSIVTDAIAHFDKWRDEKEMSLLVHCRSAKARSTGLALVLLRYHYGPGTEQQCLDELLRIRPNAAPNIAIVKHGDDVLGCNGALVKVVEDDLEICRRRADQNIRRARQIESRPSYLGL